MFLATSVIAITACGISAVGEFIEEPRPTRDGGPDAPFLLPDGARIDGASDADVPDVDPVVVCPTVCEAGTCDAGTCVIECTDAAAPCFKGKVECPPGVPCAVSCAVKDGCLLGVDCTQASACNIACTGEAACAGGVKCSGATCAVDCTGAGAACALGVECDAGTCNVACAKDDCSGGPVACASNDCHVTCGVDAAAGADGKNACKTGVTCTARDRCLIDCIGEAACQGAVIVATDGGARVHCLAFDSCKNGVIDVRARDASIVCGADDACEASKVTCADAAACAFDCKLPNDKAVSVCCPDAGCAGDSGACGAVEYKCL